MKVHINNLRDFWSGLMFTGFGASFASIATSYDMGSLNQMGPGWFPFALGLLLVGLGLIITIASFSAVAPDGDGAIEPIGWGKLFVVLSAVALFALALPWLGVVLSVMSMVLVAGLAANERRMVEMSVVAAALAGLCYAIFVRGLGVPLPVWPAFAGG